MNDELEQRIMTLRFDSTEERFDRGDCRSGEMTGRARFNWTGTQVRLRWSEATAALKVGKRVSRPILETVRRTAMAPSWFQDVGVADDCGHALAGSPATYRHSQ
jgi:hypothetical protein